jgi:hypothetical protein
VLLFKIILAPLLIGAVSLAGRRWGPSIAGWLLGLPLTSAPVLLFLTLEQGPQFAARTARGCLLGLLAWAAFTIIYAWSCLKFNWWKSTLIGWVAYFFVAAVVFPVSLSAGWDFVLVGVVLAATLMVFPKIESFDEGAEPPKYDLWLRMASATIIVVTITAIARLLGPTASGILTTFPAYSTILAVFSHRQHASAAVDVLKGVTAGLYTAATFFIALYLTLPRLHLGLAFLIAATGALLIQFSSLVYIRKNSQVSATAD